MIHSIPTEREGNAIFCTIFVNRNIHQSMGDIHRAKSLGIHGRAVLCLDHPDSLGVPIVERNGQAWTPQELAEKGFGIAIIRGLSGNAGDWMIAAERAGYTVEADYV